MAQERLSSEGTWDDDLLPRIWEAIRAENVRDPKATEKDGVIQKQNLGGLTCIDKYLKGAKLLFKKGGVRGVRSHLRVFQNFYGIDENFRQVEEGDALECVSREDPVSPLVLVSRDDIRLTLSAIDRALNEYEQVVTERQNGGPEALGKAA